MNRLVIQRLATNLKGSCVFARKFSDLRQAHSPQFIENYRSSWPDALPDQPVATIPEIQERTIPDSVITTSFTAHFDSGNTMFHPHLQTNPKDFKAILTVNLRDLGLNDAEKQIMVRMVGPRIRVGNGLIKLTAEKFPNRMENRKYLLFLLEDLVKKAKELNAVRDQYTE